MREGLLKAVEIAFDLDPFDPSWTDEQRGAGERALALLTERLKAEAGLCEDGCPLRQQLQDSKAASLNIRRQLAPLLGCDIDNEPADSMVGRIVDVTTELMADLDQVRAQLDWCGRAARYGSVDQTIKPGDDAWSDSYSDVLSLRRCMDEIRGRLGMSLKDYDAAQCDGHAATLAVLARRMGTGEEWSAAHDGAREAGSRREGLAEQRGHDKAMEWAAVLAGDFDPFSADWSDVERSAGERALGLFAEKLRREMGSPASSLGTSSAMRGTVTDVEAAMRGALSSGNVKLTRGTVDTSTPATSGYSSDSTPRWYYVSEWAPVVSHRFYLPKAARVRVSAMARVSAECRIRLSIDGEAVYIGATTSDVWRSRAPGHGDVTIERPAGWHTVTLCVVGEVEVRDCEAGWSIVEEEEPEDAVEAKEVARVTGGEWQSGVPLDFGPPIMEAESSLRETLRTWNPPLVPAPGMASVAPSAGYYRVYDSNQGRDLYVRVTADGVVWGFSEHEGVPGYRTLGKQWVTFAAEPGNERLRWMPDRDRVAGGSHFRHSMGGDVVHQFASAYAEKAACGFLPRGPYTPVASPVTCPGCIDPGRYCLLHAHMGWPRTLKADCPECSPPTPVVGGDPPPPQIGMVCSGPGYATLVTAMPWTWMATTTSITAPFSDVVVWRRG